MLQFDPQSESQVAAAFVGCLVLFATGAWVCWLAQGFWYSFKEARLRKLNHREETHG